MKINKLIIRVCHFFGLMKDSFHIDDVKMYIPTIYDNKEFVKDDPIMIDDIKKQIYRKFKEDKKFEKTCSKANQVWVVNVNHSMVKLIYQEGTLYYYCKSDNLIRKRNDEINKLI